MARIITVQNVYTRRQYDVCERHNTSDLVGDVQVQHGRHEGLCDFCEAANEAREAHNVAAWDAAQKVR